MNGAAPVAVRLDEAWDDLHQERRFQPLYPSEWVVRFLGRHGRQRPLDVLDLGCGAGRHCLTALEQGHAVTGADLSGAGLRVTGERIASRGHQAKLVATRFDALPFPDASFDLIICFGVLYYGDSRTFRRGVDEIRRCLRPGGWAQAVVRSTADHRFALGAALEPRTRLIDTDETNEEGMVMHFLDRSDIDGVFAHWSEVCVERHEHTAGGGEIVNADWVIEARR